LSVREASMGDIIRPGPVPMRLGAEVVGTAPIASCRHRHLARPGAARHAQARDQRRLRRGRSHDAGRRHTVAFDGGGLGRRISVYRLPEQDWSRRLAVDHVATFPGGADLPVYVRVTQSDGHQAWSSPIYLIA
jgi:hypothetical protein